MSFFQELIMRTGKILSPAALLHAEKYTLPDLLITPFDSLHETLQNTCLACAQRLWLNATVVTFRSEIRGDCGV
jgi:hypothetical protein